MSNLTPQNNPADDPLADLFTSERNAAGEQPVPLSRREARQRREAAEAASTPTEPVDEDAASDTAGPAPAGSRSVDATSVDAPSTAASSGDSSVGEPAITPCITARQVFVGKSAPK